MPHWRPYNALKNGFECQEKAELGADDAGGLLHAVQVGKAGGELKAQWRLMG